VPPRCHHAIRAIIRRRRPRYRPSPPPRLIERAAEVRSSVKRCALPAHDAQSGDSTMRRCHYAGDDAICLRCNGDVAAQQKTARDAYNSRAATTTYTRRNIADAAAMPPPECRFASFMLILAMAPAVSKTAPFRPRHDVDAAAEHPQDTECFDMRICDASPMRERVPRTDGGQIYEAAAAGIDTVRRDAAGDNHAVVDPQMMQVRHARAVDITTDERRKMATCATAFEYGMIF